MIGIGMPSSQRRIGILRFLRMMVAGGKIGGAACGSTAGTFNTGVSSVDHTVLYRTAAV
jgi:hypothetical protein